MKKIFVFIFLLILLINASYPKQNNKMSEADKIISTFKYPEIKWSIPVIGKDIERIVLNNGMTVFIKEEHMLPITNISVIVKTGEIY